MRMTGDYYLAGDIMQESFTRYLERYDGQAPNASLLFTIARNALFDHSRNRKRNVHLSEDPIDSSGSQEYDLMIKQAYRQVIGAMQKLEKNERDILALAIIDGLSYLYISAIVDNSVENDKLKIQRNSLKLKKIIKRGDQS